MVSSGGPPRSARQRALGQNFLVDSNILDVIERLAAVGPNDTVLEVGGGEGALSVRLAATARFLHLIEIDRRLEAGLREALAPFGNRVRLTVADALAVDLAALAPAPEAVVANLPYGIAATFILRTVEELPTVERWVCMVQREVGERLAAPVGSSAYGIPSVLAQLSCDVRVLRAVSRTVFRPVPNVDSVLVGLTRRAGAGGGAGGGAGIGDGESVRALVRHGFAHRRKALARSVALATGDPDARARVGAALATLGLPVDVRAERLSPAQFAALAEALA